MIDTQIDDRGVATITLNRPEVHNAFDDQLIATLTTHLQDFEANPAVKILLLKSNGKNYSAGADLNWMKKMVGYSQEENLKDAKALGQMLYRLYHFKKPTLTLVQGAALGGGVGLVACCQIAIAAQDATFCFSEVKLGLAPSMISPYVINAIGLRQARAYFLTAQTFPAMEAYRLGLCQGVVPLDKLEHTSDQIIAQLLQNGPQALQAVNTLMHDLYPLAITSEIMEITARTIANLRVSKEGQEGVSAFLERRKPKWIK